MVITKCRKCGCVVTDDPKKVGEGYRFCCPNCDEDKFSMEVYSAERKTCVKVTQVLTRVIEVDADTVDAALEKVLEMQNSGELRLSAEDGDEESNTREFCGYSDSLITEK